MNNPLTGMQPDERDRLTRLETKVDFIISNMESLPPSPQTIAHMKELESQLKEHSTFIEGLKLKIGIVGAGFTLFGTSLIYLFDWVIGKLHINWGN